MTLRAQIDFESACVAVLIARNVAMETALAAADEIDDLHNLLSARRAADLAVQFDEERERCNLTTQQRRVLTALSAGRSQKEAAVLLNLSLRSVQWHLAQSSIRLGTAGQLETIRKFERLFLTPVKPAR